MKKVLKVIDFIHCWTYFIVVVLLRSIRLISQERFNILLYGDPKGYKD